MRYSSRSLRNEQEVKEALERALGRPLAGVYWERLKKGGYVSDHLQDPESMPLEELLEQYLEWERDAEAYAKEKAGRPSRGARLAAEIPAEERLALEVCHQTSEAARLPGVMQFRSQRLGNSLLAEEEVEAWLMSKAKEDAERAPRGWPALSEQRYLDPLEGQLVRRLVLEPEGEESPVLGLPLVPEGRYAVDDEERRLTGSLPYRDRAGEVKYVPVYDGGILEELRRLTAALARRYWWRQEDAVTFVLTGSNPKPPLIRVYSAWTPGGERLVLEVHHLATTKQVTAALAVAKRGTPGEVKRVRRGKKRSPELLLRFVEQTPGIPWRERLRRWNEQHRDMAYTSERNLCRDYKKAKRRAGG